MVDDKKIELTKEVSEEKDGIKVGKKTTKLTREGDTWRSVSDDDLEKRIVYAYLDALDFADDCSIEEISDISKSNKNKKFSDPNIDDSEEKKLKNRDKLDHYEKLYRCYNDRRQNELKTTIVRCTAIVIIATLIFCFATLLIPSKGYVVSTDSAVTTTIDGSSHTLETSVTKGNN